MYVFTFSGFLDCKIVFCYGYLISFLSSLVPKEVVSQFHLTYILHIQIRMKVSGLKVSAKCSLIM